MYMNAEYTFLFTVFGLMQGKISADIDIDVTTWNQVSVTGIWQIVNARNVRIVLF